MKNLTIVGCGALGSHVVLFLRNEDVILKVIDFDRVEQKNTLSQFHSRSSVGKGKTQSLAQIMSFLFCTKLGTVPHKLTSENQEQLLAGSDLIIDCLDNGPGRRLVQSFAKRTATPCLHGGLAANGAYGRACWTKNFVIDDGPADGQGATCEGGEFLPFIGIVSAYIARAAQVFLATGQQIGFEVSPTTVLAV